MAVVHKLRGARLLALFMYGLPTLPDLSGNKLGAAGDGQVHL